VRERQAISVTRSLYKRLLSMVSVASPQTTKSAFHHCVPYFIECDSCGQLVEGPVKRCSACACVYYHGQTCQKKDWKTHKKTCLVFQDLKRQACGKGEEDYPASDDMEKCAICLENIRLKRRLEPCGHECCHACLTQYQDYCATATCPLCISKVPIDNVQETLIAASMLSIRANRRYKLGSMEHKNSIAEPLKRLEDVLVKAPEDRVVLGFRASLLKDLGKYQEAIDCIKSFVETPFHKTSSGEKISDGIDAMQMREYLAMAECQAVLEQHHDALESFKKSYRSINEKLVLHCTEETRAIFHGSSLCYVEIGLNRLLEVKKSQNSVIPGEIDMVLQSGKGHLDECIELGQLAERQNRHFKNTHIPMAKAYAASADFETAILLMRKAIAYEVLDGDDHIQKNEDTLQKLKLMKEEFQAFPRNSEVSKSDGSGLNADFVMAFVPKIKQL
jgi:tetratricopeptide (TPR) repeat protein